MSSSATHHSILLSQNFLKHPALVTSLLDRCDVGANDVVYEIGPGKGIMTEQLALRCRRVVAIEKDLCLAAQLRRRFAATPAVTIHQGDFLDYPLPHGPYKVVANIPFNITAAIVSKLTAAGCSPRDAYLAMQREAADVLLGRPHESLRSILCKPWFETETVYRFQRTDFDPAPRVDVVMLRLRKRGPPLVSPRDKQCFRDFVVHVYTTRHSQPMTALQSVFTRQQLRHVRHDLGLDANATPTSIAFEQWLDLFAYFKTVGDARTLREIAGSEDRLLWQQQRLQKVHRTRASGRRKI